MRRLPWGRPDKPSVDSIEERLTSVTEDLERATLELKVQVEAMRHVTATEESSAGGE